MNSRLIRNRLRRQVLVTTKDQGSFEGVLFDSDREALILRNSAQVAPGDRPLMPVDGELLIFVADVAFIQFP